MSKPLTPNLAWIFAEPFGPPMSKGEACETYRAAAKELRALLAVARAARDHSHAEVEPTRDGSDETCPICRALAGLTRVKR